MACIYIYNSINKINISKMDELAKKLYKINFAGKTKLLELTAL